ncbi:hypothetical protein KP509_03G040800 [Ceratopteris richardii]|uniref:DUF2062 domain-containing protein n=1 Tax=Ceratopteris richardii TaxID=49495 RepID=A0A8T2V2V2_CERRI|nr:hypothetical protein KP509_03G040800 [Ceratopteris richardii]
MSSEPLIVEVKEARLLSKCSFDFHVERNLKSILSGPEAEAFHLHNEIQWQHFWVVEWGKKKVLDPFIFILKRGLEPKLLSFSAALGLTVGVFPVCGVTAGLCALIAMILRSKCHWPTLVLANFVVTPLQIGLLVPFMRLGELITNEHHLPITPSVMWDVLRGHGSFDLLYGVLHAVIGWCVFAPICCAILFVMFSPTFRYLMQRFGTETTVLQLEAPVAIHRSRNQEIRVYHII